MDKVTLSHYLSEKNAYQNVYEKHPFLFTPRFYFWDLAFFFYMNEKEDYFSIIFIRILQCSHHRVLYNFW